MTKPNVLIFMTDHQRGDTVLPGGPAKTPNAAALAAEGVTFSQAFCPSPHCCPSRATFMTGLYPTQHGVWHNVDVANAIAHGLAEGVRTWCEDFAEAGYRMHYHGKWHVSHYESPADRGWENGEPGEWSDRPLPNRWPGYEKLASRPERTLHERAEGEIVMPGYPPYTLYGTNQGNKGDVKVTDRGVESLKTLAAEETDRPWCLFVGCTGPHDPYFVPQEFLDMYDPDEIELPPSFRDTLEDKPRVYQRMRHQYWGQMSEREVRESIAHYWGYCTMLDAMFGELLDALEATGEIDNTIVIYTSDHGDYCGDHGLYCKGVPAFRGAYNVPLAIRWPGGIGDAGRECDAFTTHADMAQTFWELAGCAPPAGDMPGRSITPLLAGRTPDDWRDEMHLQFNGVEVYYTQRTVFTSDWKYVYNAFDFDEMYDLRRDPHEMHNLAAPCRNPIGHDNVPERRSPAEFQPWPELSPELNAVRREMLGRMWRFAAERDDTILNPYFTVALTPYGPAEGFGAPLP